MKPLLLVCFALLTAPIFAQSDTPTLQEIANRPRVEQPSEPPLRVVRAIYDSDRETIVRTFRAAAATAKANAELSQEPERGQHLKVAETYEAAAAFVEAYEAPIHTVVPNRLLPAAANPPVKALTLQPVDRKDSGR